MKYKNVSGKDLTLPGIGLVKADGILEQPDGFNNANFIKVEKIKETPKSSEEEKEEKEEEPPRRRRDKN